MLLLQTGRRAASWDALYYRLWSNFNRYASMYYLLSPQPQPYNGSAIYGAGQKLINIDTRQTSPRVKLTVEDEMTKRTNDVYADIVIGAERPYSLIRRQYIPYCEGDTSCGAV